MRIIKDGTKPQGTTEVTCPQCNSVLEVDADDWRLMTDYRNDSYFTVRCPCCSNHIFRR